MKRLKFLLIVLILGCLCVNSCSTNPDTIFAQRLSELISVTKHHNSNITKKTAKLDQLKSFSKEFPESELSDDAIFLSIIIPFIKNVKKDRQQSMQDILHMQQVISKHPKGKLEVATMNILKKEIGARNPTRYVYFYVPYKYIVPFMEGERAYYSKDYKSTRDIFSYLKDELNNEIPNVGVLAEEIYSLLLESYALLSKPDKFRQIAYEAEVRFPKTRLPVFIKKIAKKRRIKLPIYEDKTAEATKEAN